MEEAEEKGSDSPMCHPISLVFYPCFSIALSVALIIHGAALAPLDVCRKTPRDLWSVWRRFVPKKTLQKAIVEGIMQKIAKLNRS